MQIANKTLIEMLNGMAEAYVNDTAATWSIELFPKDEDAAWLESDMVQALSALRSCADVNELPSEEFIEVVDVEGDMHGYVLRIDDRKNIANYCFTEDFHHAPHKWLTRLQLDSVMLPSEFASRMRAVLAKHIVHPDTFEVELESWRGRLKAYAIKQAYIFEFKSRDASYRLQYVLEVTRSVMRENHVFKDAHTSSKVKEFAFSVRMDAPPAAVPSTRVAQPIQLSQDILAHAIRLGQIIHNEPVFLSAEERLQILDGYNSLLKHVRLPTHKRDKDMSAEERKDFLEPFFLAPKPINLERIHLLEPRKYQSVTSILSGYAVTDKADGERMLLYVDANLDAYLLNNTLDIKATGLKARSAALKHTLLDGEFISRHASTHLKDIFAVFDLYFLTGESKMGLPLMTSALSASGAASRYGFMQTALKPSNWDASRSVVDLRLKTHYAGDGADLFQHCKHLLSSRELPYQVDGLIFTPTDLPVFGYYPSNKDIKISARATRWDRVLKWKPEKYNTIDFLVRDAQTTTDIDTRQDCRVFKLCTGYNVIQNTPLDVETGMQILTDPSRRKAYQEDAVYRAEPFRPVQNYVEGVENAILPITAKGDILDAEGHPIDIADDTIVEFAFDRSRSDHVSKCWVPLRVREDKTRIYRTTHAISKTANDISVANSIWRNIHDPVTEKMITGDEQVDVPVGFEQLGSEQIVSADKMYYARDVPRNRMLSFHMLNFHNLGIKDELYRMATASASDSIMELACGKAGDLPRWMRLNYRTVIGIDIVKENIQDPRDGSYARVIGTITNEEQRNRKFNIRSARRLPTFAFAVADCSKPLATGEAARGIDDKSEALLKFLYSDPHVHPRPLKGIARGGFDIVSCQFAIHYFFETPEKLDGFLTNVSENLKSGGRFIFTFMDGNAVDRMLQAAPNGVTEGKKDGKTVWAIIKSYDQFDGRLNMFGKTVNVYLENTNQLITEYLVNFDFLISQAESKGLQLHSSEMFGDTFRRLGETLETRAKAGGKRPMPFNEQSLLESIKQLRSDPVQTQFSFVNRWAIFTKV